jgi:hypothetical protein
MSGIAKTTFLDMLASGRFRLPYQEVVSARTNHIDEVDVDALLYDGPEDVKELPFREHLAEYPGRERVEALFLEWFEKDALRNARRWRLITVDLNDEQWEAMWQANSHKEGVARACAQWEAEHKFP